MRYKINKTILLLTLYNIEDKQQYKNKELTRYIDKLQNTNKKIRFLNID